MGVLVQPAVAGLGETEEALDDEKGMLHLGAHVRHGTVGCLLCLA